MSLERKKWTPEELEKLHTLYPSATHEELCKEIGHSIKSIQAKASKLGIRRNVEFEQSELAKFNQSLFVPIGEYRIHAGRLDQKVAIGKRGFQNWKAVHRIVWEKERGPIPANHLVVFKPGMQTTVLEEITIDRLELISRAQQMNAHSVARFPKELRDLIFTHRSLKRKLKEKEKHDGKSE